MDLVADMGGTRIKLGLAEAGVLRTETIIPSHSDRGFAQAWERMVVSWRDLAAEHGVALGDCRAIGMGFPAMCDVAAGRVHNHFGKFTDAKDHDLSGLAHAACGLPLFVDNDARVAAMGEWRFGAGHGSDNLAMITLGTGVGTGVIAGGAVLRGRGQLGSHGGHTVILAGGHRCVCGQEGCIEAETGSRLLPHICREQSGFADSSLAAITDLDYKAVFQHAAAGDAVATQVRDRAIGLWAVFCANVCHWFDCDRLVIGGGILKDAAIILPVIQDHIDRLVAIPGAITVVTAEDPDHMGLLGAHALVEEQLRRNT